MMGTPMADASAANVAGNKTPNLQPHWLDRAAGRAYVVSTIPWVAGLSAARTVAYAIKTLRPSKRTSAVLEYLHICGEIWEKSTDKMVSHGFIGGLRIEAYSEEELREMFVDADRFANALARLLDIEAPPNIFEEDFIQTLLHARQSGEGGSLFLGDILDDIKESLNQGFSPKSSELN